MDLVIGGAGFLGGAIVEALSAAGRPVTVLDRQPSGHPRARSIVADLRDARALGDACRGVDTVFHCAAAFSMSHHARSMLHEVNVLGTRRVIEACRAEGVRRLVYTSTVDVVFDGTPIAGGDESLPYPARHLDAYAETKALAEREVLAADGAGGLRTCSLRPAGIYGPGDRLRVPALIAAARGGKLVRLGDGGARFSHVFVDNVAHAHVLAAAALGEGSPVAGRAYFITDHPAANFFDFLEPLLGEVGIRYARLRVPRRAAEIMAVVAEWAHRIAGRGRGAEPALTRYSVAAVCVDFWFHHARAARDFGYRPIVPLADALRRTAAWLRLPRGGEFSISARPLPAVISWAPDVSPRRPRVVR